MPITVARQPVPPALSAASRGLESLKRHHRFDSILRDDNVSSLAEANQILDPTGDGVVDDADRARLGLTANQFVAMAVLFHQCFGEGVRPLRGHEPLQAHFQRLAGGTVTPTTPTQPAAATAVNENPEQRYTRLAGQIAALPPIAAGDPRSLWNLMQAGMQPALDFRLSGNMSNMLIEGSRTRVTFNMSEGSGDHQRRCTLTLLPDSSANYDVTVTDTTHGGQTRSFVVTSTDISHPFYEAVFQYANRHL